MTKVRRNPHYDPSDPYTHHLPQFIEDVRPERAEMADIPRDEYSMPIDEEVAKRVDEAVRVQKTQGNIRRANANPPRSIINKEVVHDPSAMAAQGNGFKWAPIDLDEDAKHFKFHNLVRQMLELLGENPDRPGIQETPRRVADAWLDELCDGYGQDPAAILKTFDREDTEGGNNLVIVRDIPVNSLCEHHMLPMMGHAHIAYLPADRIVGLSKFKRLVDVYAHRLQVQERLTDEIADAFWHIVNPKGVMVVMQLEHMCMRLRGVEVTGSTTVTSAVRGLFRDVVGLRQEAMDLIKG